jgi:hypothetical protein
MDETREYTSRICGKCGGELRLEKTCCSERRAGHTRVYVCNKCHSRSYPHRKK